MVAMRAVSCLACHVWRTTALGACNSPDINWHVVLQVSDFGLSRTVEQEAVNTVSCGCSELRAGWLVGQWLGSELAVRVFWQQGAHSFPLGCPLLGTCSLRHTTACAAITPLVHACMHHMKAAPKQNNHPAARLAPQSPTCRCLPSCRLALQSPTCRWSSSPSSC